MEPQPPPLRQTNTVHHGKQQEPVRSPEKTETTCLFIQFVLFFIFVQNTLKKQFCRVRQLYSLVFAASVEGIVLEHH